LRKRLLDPVDHVLLRRGLYARVNHGRHYSICTNKY
jgi:hypothetical protein